MHQQYLTAERAKELLAKVDEIHKTGKSIAQARKEVGLSHGQLYTWKRKLVTSLPSATTPTRKKRKPKAGKIQIIETKLEENPEHIVSIYGLLTSGTLVKLADLPTRKVA